MKEEARRLHNKELMTELNKGRDTIERNIQIRYPCSRCGKDMVWDVPRAKDREQIMGLLKDGGIGGWSHTTCQTVTS